MDARRPFEIGLHASQAGPALGRYARTCLTKLRSHADEALDVDDLAASTPSWTNAAARHPAP
ncbi:hypothetical protein ACFZBU_40570 [Embleya sp. NPDC008237]|uniref:hypothetical protein n=1 Tax=Embleya sp. NPDC008237 TaxID=3363978 RepID=UPI0036EB58E3